MGFALNTLPRGNLHTTSGESEVSFSCHNTITINHITCEPASLEGVRVFILRKLVLNEEGPKEPRTHSRHGFKDNEKSNGKEKGRDTKTATAFFTSGERHPLSPTTSEGIATAI